MTRPHKLVLLLALTCCAGLARPAVGCHLPADIRESHEVLTPAQLMILAHGDADMRQIPYRIDGATGCADGMADIFPCENVDLLEVVQLGDIGGGTGNDLWGWKDPVTGVEYALVGRSNGTAFIDVSDPENPVYVGNLPTHSVTSSWRDIKVYQDHAFIVADYAGSHGMQVFDLSNLRQVVSPPATFSNTAHYDGFARAHNLVINEDTGFAYAVGSNTCSGGLHMIDIRSPTAPMAAGCFSADGYTHDAQCVVYSGPDTLYRGRELCFAANEDTLTVVDVTDKSSPVQISRTGYSGSAYTHQGWLTEDQTLWVHDDELDERNFGHNTRTYAWDVSDLDQPVITATYTSDGNSIDHNQYVHNGFTYQANYRRGLRILTLDRAREGILEEVAGFDTYPEGDGTLFNGAWSVYPFFDSGIVIVSDINRGLFILQPRLNGDAIFEDGFESGDVSGWDAQVAAD